MALESELELSDVLSCHSFVIEVEELGSDLHWIDVVKPHREKHLTVPQELLEHLRVAVFENKEELLNLLEDLLLWL